MVSVELIKLVWIETASAVVPTLLKMLLQDNSEAENSLKPPHLRIGVVAANR